MTATKRHFLLTYAIGVGVAEIVGLLVYSAAIAISYTTHGTQGTVGSNVSPYVLSAFFIAFALLIALVVRGLVRGLGSARSPFLVTQAFALAVAQVLFTSGVAVDQVLGIVIAIAGISSLIAILTPAASRGLNIQR